MEMITLDTKEYKELMESAKKLYTLECHGVSNWEGYSEAMDDIDGVEY